MVKERQQPHPEDINFKAIATGRPRKWDARLMPKDVVAMMKKEFAKAPWSLYVLVLGNGQFVSRHTPEAELIRLIDEHDAVGFIGALAVSGNQIQFFTRSLKRARPEVEQLLDAVVNDLRRRATQPLEAIEKNSAPIFIKLVNKK